MKKSQKTFLDIIIALAAAGITALAIVTEPLYALDAMLCDAVYSRMNGTGDDIVIVSIDEETLAEYGVFSEWSRSVSARLAEYLYENENEAPAMMAYDIMFVGETADDGKLAEAFAGKNIVCASNFVYRGTTVEQNGEIFYDAWNISAEERPFDALDKIFVRDFQTRRSQRTGL